MDARALPARPSVAQYRKQAKDLLKSHKSARFVLADAQLTIAREHAFESWPKFVKHIEGLTRRSSPVSRFESAVDAVVSGDAATLDRLLRETPALVRARSMRGHRATLLHYVSANGVEDFRQKTPRNIVKLTRLLLKAGADVDAVMESYGAGSTTLGLTATSAHPARAGVMNALLKTLVDAGAAVDGARGGWNPLIAALHNGRPEGAQFLAEHGARLDLEGAAGVGRLDVVKTFFNAAGALKANATKAQMDAGFFWACEYGKTDVVDFLLERGVDVGQQDDRGMTGLHWATHGGHLDTVKLLLERKAPLELENAWGGTVLGGTIWCAVNVAQAEPFRRHADYVPIITRLIAAGAAIDPAWSTGIRRIDTLLRRRGAT
jgi:hypothetical protein